MGVINEDYYLITESENYFFSETLQFKYYEEKNKKGGLIKSISKNDTISSNHEIKVPKLKKNEIKVLNYIT